MGLLDKMKAQASQVVDKAQEAGKAGQAKLDQLQAKRRTDTLLEELGRITYRAANDQTSTSDEAHVAELVAQIKAYEAEYGSIDAAPSTP